MAKHWDEKYLSEIIDHLKNGELYLFAGAGLSQLAGYPSWGELICEFAKAYQNCSNADRNIIEDLPKLKRRKDTVIIEHLIGLGRAGEDEYVKVIRNNFIKNDFCTVHKKLLMLPFRGFITTNIDICFEEAYKKTGLNDNMMNERWFSFPEHKKMKTNIEDVFKPGNFLLHMHGCVSHNGEYDYEKLILRPEQYRDYYKKNIMERIFSDLLTKPLLVLGVSMSDPFFMSKFMSVRSGGRINTRANRHDCYVTIREEEYNEKTPASDYQEMGIKYCSFQDYKTGLSNMIEELEEAFNVGKHTIAQENNSNQ